VAAEADGRVRLAHAENNDEGTLKSSADSQIALDSQVVTDGLATATTAKVSACGLTRLSSRPNISGARTTPCGAAT
jgi:hypothetical protein